MLGRAGPAQELPVRDPAGRATQWEASRHRPRDAAARKAISRWTARDWLFLIGVVVIDIVDIAIMLARSPTSWLPAYAIFAIANIVAFSGLHRATRSRRRVPRHARSRRHHHA